MAKKGQGGALEDPFYGIEGVTEADRTSQSPRARRSSTNGPLEFSKGEVQQGMGNPSKQGGDANADVEWDNASYNKPYLDGGGIYSKPRRKA